MLSLCNDCVFTYKSGTRHGGWLDALKLSRRKFGLEYLYREIHQETRHALPSPSNFNFDLQVDSDSCSAVVPLPATTCHYVPDARRSSFWPYSLPYYLVLSWTLVKNVKWKFWTSLLNFFSIYCASLIVMLWYGRSFSIHMKTFAEFRSC